MPHLRRPGHDGPWNEWYRQKLRMLQPNNIRIEYKIPVRIFVGEKESEYHRHLYMLRVWQKPKAGPNYLVTHFATELEF